MKNRITKLEEQAYRLTHHEFQGCTIKETAEIMGLTECKIRRLLKSLEANHSQLFPILSKQQFQVYRMVTEHGLTQTVIAAVLKTSQSTIHDMIQRMKDQGMPGLNVEGLGDTVSYDSSMDAHIKQRF